MSRLIAGLLGFLVATAACSVGYPLDAQAIGAGQNTEEGAVPLAAAATANVLWGPDRDLEAGYRLLTPSCRDRLSFEEARRISATEISLVNQSVVELEGPLARVAYDVVDGDGNVIVAASDNNAEAYRRIDGTWLAACEP